MIGMQLIEELVKTTILTGRVTNNGCHPVSLLLISPPEHGKTSILMNKLGCETLLLMNDVTGNGIREIVKSHGAVTHIALLDMLMSTSHRATANQYLIANIAAVAEEGYIGEATPAGVKIMKEPVRKAFIICMTPSMTADGRTRWTKAGITSRMLPFNYTFTELHKLRIRKSINADKLIELDMVGFKVPQPTTVKFPASMIEKIDRFAHNVSTELSDDTGFRRLKQFRALACGHALYRTWKKPEVTEKDIDFLARIAPYISYTKGCEL